MAVQQAPSYSDKYDDSILLVVERLCSMLFHKCFHTVSTPPQKTGSLSSQEKHLPSTLTTLWFPGKAGRKLSNLIKVVTSAHICASPLGHDHTAPRIPQLCLQIQGKNQHRAAPRLTLEISGKGLSIFV